MMHERIYVVGKNRNYYLLYIFIAFLLIAIGIWQLVIPSEIMERKFKSNNSYVAHFFGIWLIAFSVFVILNAILQMRSKEPSLILNESELKISGFAPIHWSEIDSFLFSYKYKYGLIFVILKDQKSFIRKHNRLKRIFLRLSSFGVESPVYISGQFLLNIDLKELSAILNYELGNYNLKH
jgi:hypothetical protein